MGFTYVLRNTNQTTASSRRLHVWKCSIQNRPSRSWRIYEMSSVICRPPRLHRNRYQPPPEASTVAAVQAATTIVDASVLPREMDSSTVTTAPRHLANGRYIDFDATGRPHRRRSACSNSSRRGVSAIFNQSAAGGGDRSRYTYFPPGRLHPSLLYMRRRLLSTP